MIRGFEMKKKCDKLLGILCYALGYNFFKGDEDPDWAAIEARFRNKHSDTTNEDLLKEREV